MNTNLAVNPIKRLAYAFVGLLAGNVILLLFLLQNAIRIRADLLAWHMGEPARQIPIALEMFVFYARFSFVSAGLFVGLPIALFLPARLITHLPWPLIVFVGVALGPLTLFVILVVLSHGHIGSGSFRGMGIEWAYSILVSAVSFGVYAALLRREKVVE